MSAELFPEPCLTSVSQAAYIRLIYSTVEDIPPSCVRTVEGNATFQVVGWSAEIEHIGFLMPMTLINLFSLIIIVTVLVMSKGQAHNFDPTDTRPLLAANAPEGQKPEDWDDRVFYLSRREVRDYSVVDVRFCY